MPRCTSRMDHEKLSQSSQTPGTRLDKCWCPTTGSRQPLYQWKGADRNENHFQDNNSCSSPCSPPRPDAVQSAGVKADDQLRTALAGNSLVGNGKTPKGVPWDVVYHLLPDGSMNVYSAMPSWQGTDTGTWWVDESGNFCRKFVNWSKGQPGCWALVQDGDSIQFNRTSGFAPKWRGRIVPGNALPQ
jgi:hypothetical protein